MAVSASFGFVFLRVPMKGYDLFINALVEGFPAVPRWNGRNGRSLF